jgi:hypothetical protein
MLSTTAFAPGEVSLRELMLGLIAVAVFVGIVVGRNTERARRTYKDWDAAKVALKKGRGIALGEIRKAVVTVLVIAGLLLAVFIGAMKGLN